MFRHYGVGLFKFVSMKHISEVEVSKNLKEIVGLCTRCGERAIFELKNNLCEICRAMV